MAKAQSKSFLLVYTKFFLPTIKRIITKLTDGRCHWSRVWNMRYNSKRLHPNELNDYFICSRSWFHKFSRILELWIKIKKEVSLKLVDYEKKSQFTNISNFISYRIVAHNSLTSKKLYSRAKNCRW